MFTRSSYDKDVYNQMPKSKLETYRTDEKIYYNNDVCLPSDNGVPFNPTLFGQNIDNDSEMRGITRKINKKIDPKYVSKLDQINVINTIPKNCDNTQKMTFSRMEDYFLNTGIILDRNDTSFTSQSNIDYMELKYTPRQNLFGMNSRLLYRDNYKQK